MLLKQNHEKKFKSKKYFIKLIFTLERTEDKKYVDIILGKNCRKFRLTTWTSLINQSVHPVGGEGSVILANYKFYFY